MALGDDQDEQVDLETWERRVFEKNGIPDGLRKSIMAQESGGDVNAVSPSGVRGKWQVTKRTAQQYGLNRDDPWEQPIAAAKYLREGYDEAKKKNPNFSDRQAWLASSARYSGGPDAFDASGELSTRTRDGLTNPARYAESIAKRWSEIEAGTQPQQSQTAQPRSSQPRPTRQQPKIKTRGPVQPQEPSPFGLNQPTGFQAAQQQVAQRTAGISPEVQAQADKAAQRRDEMRRQYEQKGFVGQRLEDIGQGLAGVGESAQRGFENVLSATGLRKGISALSPSAGAALQRGQEAQEYTRQLMAERQAAADSLAAKTTRALTSGVVGATTMAPVAMAGGVPAVMAATGIQQDWNDPGAAALNTALAGVPIVAGRAISPFAARVGSRVVSPLAQQATQRGIEATAGGVTGAGQYAATQGILGRPIDPEEALAQGISGAGLGAAMAPRLPRRAAPTEILDRQLAQPATATPAEIRAKMLAGRPTITPTREYPPAPLGPRIRERQRVLSREATSQKEPLGPIRERPRIGDLPRVLPERPTRPDETAPLTAPIPEAPTTQPTEPITPQVTPAAPSKAEQRNIERGQQVLRARDDAAAALKRATEAAEAGDFDAARLATVDRIDALRATRAKVKVDTPGGRKLRSELGRQIEEAQNRVRDLKRQDREATRERQAIESAPTRGLPPPSTRQRLAEIEQQRPSERIREYPGGELPVAPRRSMEGQPIEQVTRETAAKMPLMSTTRTQAPTERPTPAPQLRPRTSVSEAIPQLPASRAKPLGAYAEELRGDIPTEDLQAYQRLLSRYEAEQPRPEGIKTRSGEPFGGLSQYSDIVRNNRDAVNRLAEMNVDSAEAKPLIRQIRQYTQKNRLDEGHVENLLNSIRNDQLQRAQGEDIATAEPSRPTGPLSPDDARLNPPAEGAEMPVIPARRAKAQEAREIVSNLDKVADQLSVQDRRFLRSWKQYLERTGEKASVDEQRLTYLRRLRDRIPTREVQPERQPSAPLEIPPETGPTIQEIRAQERERIAKLSPQDLEAGLSDVEAKRNAAVRNPESTDAQRQDLADQVRLYRARRAELVKAKQLPPLNVKRPPRAERPKAVEAAERPSPLDQDVRVLDEPTLEKRIREAERILNNPELNPARKTKVEDFLRRARDEKGKRTPEMLEHPDEALNGKPILARTAEGKAVVENPANKGGVSVVKDRGAETPEPKMEMKPTFTEERTLPNGAKEFTAKMGDQDLTIRQISKGGSWDVIKEGKVIASRLPKEAAKRRARSELTRTGEETPEPASINRQRDENLKAFLRESKVKTPEGEPIPVYHGTQSPTAIDVINPAKLDPNALYGPGFYTTQDADIAAGEGGYAGTKIARDSATGEELSGKPHAYKLYLDIRNPLDVNAKTDRSLKAKAIKDFGDDIIIKNDLERAPTNEQVYDAIVRATGDKAAANKYLKDQGFDGITHIGGDNWGTQRHLTFSDRIKAEAKAGEVGGRVEEKQVTPDNTKAVAELLQPYKVPRMLAQSLVTALKEKISDQYTQEQLTGLRNFGVPENVIKQAQEMAASGARPQYEVKGHKVWIAFDSRQVKSATGNRGTFDPDEPSILASIRKNYFNTPRVEQRPETIAEGRQLVDNVRSEFRQKKDAPGTIITNHQGTIVMASAAKQMGVRIGSAGEFQGMAPGLENANKMADFLEYAADTYGPAGKKLTALAGQIREAITDAKANGRDSIVIADLTAPRNLREGKQLLREERFHQFQKGEALYNRENAIKINEALSQDRTYRRIKVALRRREKYTNDPVVMISEASAKIASGQSAEYGLTEQEGLDFYKRYLREAVKLVGPDVLAKRIPGTAGAQEAQANVRSEIEGTRLSRGMGRSPRVISAGQGLPAPASVGRNVQARGAGSSGQGDGRKVSATQSARNITADILRAQPDQPAAAPPTQPSAAQASSRKGLGAITAESLRAERPSTLPSMPSPQPQSRFSKAFSVFGDLYHGPKSLLSSFDISAAGRQGLFLSLPPSQLPTATRAMGRQLKSLVSTKAYDRFVDTLRNNQNYQTGKDAGLFLATDDPASSFSARDETFVSKLIGKLPHVKYSEQAYKTYLDSLRMDTFTKYKGLIDKQPGTAEQKQTALEAAADWINTSTGRGKIHGKFGETVESATPLLNTIFFAPRYTISRFQMLNPITYGRNLAKPETRVVFKRQMSELFQSAGVLAVTAGIAKAAGTDISLDPDEADFLKLKFGNTRYDILAGLQQTARLAARIGNWLKEEATEEDQKRLTGTRGATAEAVKRFGRTKLAPVPSFFVDWLNDWKNVIGERTTPGQFSIKNPILQRTLPLLFSDVVEAYQRGYREGGTERGVKTAARFAPAVGGVGVADYERKPGRVSLESGSGLSRELKRYGQQFESVRPKLGEPEKLHRERAQRVEDWFGQYGEKLVNSSEYQRATPEQQEEALKSLRRAIGAQANLKAPRLDGFDAGRIFRSLRAGETRRERSRARYLYQPDD
jgi:hypothetical protein